MRVASLNLSRIYFTANLGLTLEIAEGKWSLCGLTLRMVWSREEETPLNRLIHD